jgi:flagellar hook protein FlgE
MDVIGNNISNVNTIGYKNRRLTFEEGFSQMMKGASRSASKAGGQNPMQVGLGTNVGSIDVIQGQGSLQSTGNIFDLAIEGNAFFGVSDGTGTYYTRNGGFRMDAEGYIILPTNGMVLQGKMADLQGQFPRGTAITNLQMPLHQQSPAKETSEVVIARNLDANADAKGTIIYSQPMLAPAIEMRADIDVGSVYPITYTGTTSISYAGTGSIAAGNYGVGSFYRAGETNSNQDMGHSATTLQSLYNSNGQSLNIKSDDILTVSFYVEDVIIPGITKPIEFKFKVQEPPANSSYDPSKPITAGDPGDPLATPPRAPIPANMPYNGWEPPGNNGVAIVWTLEDLAKAIEYTINHTRDNSGSIIRDTDYDPADDNGPGGTNETGHRVLPNIDGSLRIEYQAGSSTTPPFLDGGQTIRNLQINSSNPESNSYVSQAFNFGAYIGPGDTAAGGLHEQRFLGKSDVLLRPAEQFDYMASLRDGTGKPLYLGLDNGDPIDVYGNVSGKTIDDDDKMNPLLFAASGGWEDNPMNFGSNTGPTPNNPWDNRYDFTRNSLSGPNGTVLNELMCKILCDFDLPLIYTDRDGKQLPSAGLQPANADEFPPPPGSLVIRGQKGKDFSLDTFSVKALNSNSDGIAPTVFNSVMQFTRHREAQDVGFAEVTSPVYDTLGEEHMLTIRFVHTGRAGEWEWTASFAGKEEIVSGGHGKVSFGQDSTVSSFLYDDAASQLVFDPRNGAKQVRMNLNVGGPGNDKGLVQYDAPTTAQAIGQDGYTTGQLMGLEIDEFGIISGSFSNGIEKTIAQIMLVDFANPAGLIAMSDSVYLGSANSGDAIWGRPKDQSSSNLKPGTLEISNVDLAAEFTNMITTQRGYQANSRIITVSDSMLEELVNLKR